MRVQDIRRGDRMVEESAKEFYQLVARNDLLEFEEHPIAQFIDGYRR